MEDLIKVNRYGAIDITEFIKLQAEIDAYKDMHHTLTESMVCNFQKIEERLKKIEELTKANDYKYQTETKLVKVKKT